MLCSFLKGVLFMIPYYHGFVGIFDNFFAVFVRGFRT